MALAALAGISIFAVNGLAAPADATAFFREGQTFLTWQEDNAVSGEWYCVYASTQPITTNNLSQAQRVAKIPEGSRHFQFLRNINIQSSGFWTDLVQEPWYEAIQIEDDENGAKQLAAGTGLFVRTIHGPATNYYAVTVESGGVEDRAAPAATATPVAESVGTPGAVLQQKLGDRYYLYAFFCDYEVWNPDGIEDNWEGYVHVFHIRAPAANAANTREPYPVSVRLHAYAAWDDWELPSCIPPTHVNVRQLDYHLTWWYGYSDNLPGTTPGTVVNFTERRVQQVARWLAAGPTNFPFAVDPQRFSVFGGSMGGTGTHAIGARNGDLFAAAFADEGIQNWALDGRWNAWDGNVVGKWGTRDAPFPPWNDVPTYDALNQTKQAAEHPERETPFLDIGQGIIDYVIPFHDVDKHWKALEAGKHPYAATWGLFAHVPWAGPASVMDYLKIRRDEVLPAFANASCNSRLDSSFRNLADSSNMTATTLSIAPGALTADINKRGQNDDDGSGNFTNIVGMTLVLGPGALVNTTYFRIASNTATELTIESGDLLAYMPALTPYSLSVLKSQLGHDPTPEEIAARVNVLKKEFLVCDGEPIGVWNAHFQWSTRQQNFDTNSTADEIIDTSTNLAICLRVTTHSRSAWNETSATADVTPRRCRNFRPLPGEPVNWQNWDLSVPASPVLRAQGQVAADAHGLVTVPGFVIGRSGWGSKLTMSRSGTYTVPAVTMVVTNPVATEVGPTVGQFTVSRGARTDGDLAVSFTIGGTATPGGSPGDYTLGFSGDGTVDYAAKTGSVTIADGTADATISVTPVDDAVVEPPETVLLALAGGAYFYNVGNPSNAAGVIVREAAGNILPLVEAGADQSLAVNTLPTADVSLEGTLLYDDGVPGAPTYAWTKDSGPGTVTFGDATQLVTTASFDQAGVYVLRLTADDGDLQGEDTLTITVQQNAAPVVDAGGDQSVSLAAGIANLDGTLTLDDGLPATPAIVYAWTKDSGPGTVTFGNAALIDTTATFSEGGVYVLRLSATDGLGLAGSDTVTFTVLAPVSYTAQASGRFNAESTWTPAGGPPRAGDTATIGGGFTVSTLSAGEVNGEVTVNLQTAGTLLLTDPGTNAIAPIHSNATVNVAAGGKLEIQSENNVVGTINLNGGTIAHNIATGGSGNIAAGATLNVNSDSFLSPVGVAVVRINAPTHGTGKLTLTADAGSSDGSFKIPTTSTWSGAWDFLANIRFNDGTGFKQRWIPGDARVAAGKTLYCVGNARTMKGTRTGAGMDRLYLDSTNSIGDGSGNGVLSPGDGAGGVGTVTFHAFNGASGYASHTLKFNAGSTYVADINGTTTNAYDITKSIGNGTGTGNVQVVAGANLTVNLWTPATNTVLDATIISGTGTKLGAGDFTVTWNQTGGWSGLGTSWVGPDLHITGTYTPGGSGDSNGNGIPDAWELQYFGSLTNSVSDDADRDGLSNYGEWVAGTNPTNNQSVLAFTNMLQNAGSATVVRWASESNRYYTLLLSTNLMSDPFSTVLTNRTPATPPLNVHTDSVTRPGGAMYRITVEL
jgi:hypothetical protein